MRFGQAYLLTQKLTSDIRQAASVSGLSFDHTAFRWIFGVGIGMPCIELVDHTPVLAGDLLSEPCEV